MPREVGLRWNGRRTARRIVDTLCGWGAEEASLEESGGSSTKVEQTSVRGLRRSRGKVGGCRGGVGQAEEGDATDTVGAARA